MTDNEIIKALECCSVPKLAKKKCSDCPFNGALCFTRLNQESLNLIKRQQEEIAELKVETERLDMDKWWKEKLSELQKPLLKAYNQFRFDEAVKERTKELQAEIEKLHPYKLHYGNLKTEIIREFADRLKAKGVTVFGGGLVVTGNAIDNLLEEMEKECEGN